jgi:hypothetical protein
MLLSAIGYLRVSTRNRAAAAWGLRHGANELTNTAFLPEYAVMRLPEGCQKAGGRCPVTCPGALYRLPPGRLCADGGDRNIFRKQAPWDHC